MAYIVTSSFENNSLKRIGAEVVRKFTIGPSDYSERVVKWPKFKRSAQEFKISNLKIQLANNDGALNNFYEKTYSMVTSAYVQFGFDYGGSGPLVDYSEVFSDHTFHDVTRGVSSLDYVKIVEDSGASGHRIEEAYLLEPNGLYTYGLKIKDGGKNQVILNVFNGGISTDVRIYLDDGTYISNKPEYVSVIGVNSEDDGFWRASVKIKDLQNSYYIISLYLVNSNGQWDYQGDGTSGIWAGDASLKSSQELINVFTGNFSKVSYTKEKTIIHLKDKLFDLTQNVIGDTSSVVDILSVLPSDLAWTLCTCYGQLSTIQNTTNPDIDWDSFNRFAQVWSDSHVFVHAHYAGEKVSEALSRLSKITDSTIYGEGDGKVYFQRYSNIATETTVITENETIKLDLDVLAKSIINRQIIGWDYSQESNYSVKTVAAVNSTSQNSFGVYENFLEDKTVWFVDSTGALEIAQRMLTRYQFPPKLWTVKTPLPTITRQLGETAKLVNSFYNVSSVDGQRITEITFDTHNSAIELKTDESVSFRGFTLDVDSLDSPDRFLL